MRIGTKYDVEYVRNDKKKKLSIFSSTYLMGLSNHKHDSNLCCNDSYFSTILYRFEYFFILLTTGTYKGKIILFLRNIYDINCFTCNFPINTLIFLFKLWIFISLIIN